MEALLCAIMTFANVLVLFAVSNASRLKNEYLKLLNDRDHKCRLLAELEESCKLGFKELEYLRKINAELHAAIETGKLTAGIDTTNAQE